MDSGTYTKLVQLSARTACAFQGKLAHAHMIKTSFKPCLFLLNNLLHMYIKCHEVDAAHKLFDRMHERKIISYNLMISGFTQMGLYKEAVAVLMQCRFSGLRPDMFTYAAALGICVRAESLHLGKIIHGLVVSAGLTLQGLLANTLIDMYSKCGQVHQARLVFEHCNGLDEVSWNSLISGYSQAGAHEEMLGALINMMRSGFTLNTYVLGSVLKACCLGLYHSYDYGEALHGCAIKIGFDSDIVVVTALLDMYAKIGHLNTACQVFNFMPYRNVIMYNAMIAGLTQHEADSRAALPFFLEMQQRGIRPSKFTYSSIIKACYQGRDFECGKQIHGLICKNDLHYDEFIASALIDLYSLSSSVADGLKCFHATPRKDIVSCTSMISCLSQHENYAHAMKLFHEFLESGRKPDEFMISCMLGVCADLAIARSGEQIHAYAIRTGIGSFTVVQNSQCYMYAKSGDLPSASLTFRETSRPDMVSWTVIICSFAIHGYVREAIDSFKAMKTHVLIPNDITLLGLLTACSHGGLVDEGMKHFKSLREDYGMVPNVRHCACMVDLLGRAGKLADAEKVITTSGFHDDPVLWRALLSACRVHKNLDLGQHAAQKLADLDPHNSSSYVLLFNMYIDAGKQDLANRVRSRMKICGVKKEPGLSWLEADGTVHSFVAGDRAHVRSKEIHARLNEMLDRVRGLGVGREIRYELSDEDCADDGVKYHSELLAVAFGVITLPCSAPIRVMKNLRICCDCHARMKLFSTVEKRKIVVRDPIRFHHFSDGSCSCGDYW